MGRLIATSPMRAATQSILLLRMMTSFTKMKLFPFLSNREKRRALPRPPRTRCAARVEVLVPRPLTRGHPTGSGPRLASGNVMSCLETTGGGPPRNPRREGPFWDSIRGLGSGRVAKTRQDAGRPTVSDVQEGLRTPPRSVTGFVYPQREVIMRSSRMLWVGSSPQAR